VGTLSAEGGGDIEGEPEADAQPEGEAERSADTEAVPVGDCGWEKVTRTLPLPLREAPTV
jgi:hypothetical protein